MTVIPFPPATDRPKPGKAPPEVPGIVLILPVIYLFPAEHVVKEGSSLQHLWDEADSAWVPSSDPMPRPSHYRAPPAGAGSD